FGHQRVGVGIARHALCPLLDLLQGMGRRPVGTPHDARQGPEHVELRSVLDTHWADQQTFRCRSHRCPLNAENPSRRGLLSRIVAVLRPDADRAVIPLILTRQPELWPYQELAVSELGQLAPLGVAVDVNSIYPLIVPVRAGVIAGRGLALVRGIVPAE